MIPNIVIETLTMREIEVVVSDLTYVKWVVIGIMFATIDLHNH